ncbi:MAG: hypothetical protein ACI9LY_001587 [Arenicella sp.]|jgi:hypothetical protein
MKNIVLALIATLLVSACSSGSTATELPQNITSLFTGTYQNTPGTQSGTMTLDIVEDTAGGVTGNLIFVPAGNNNCLTNTPVSGTSNGFNLSLTGDQSGEVFTTTITTTSTSGSTSTTTTTSRTGQVGTESFTNSDGSARSEVTSVVNTSGTLNMQFSISNDGNNLGGTYIVDGDTCSNQTGSGTMTLTK